jgi:hypothetical protein
MSFHRLIIRFDECDHLHVVRKPNDTLLIPLIVRHARCRICHPETLASVCGGCLLPWSIVKFHSHDLYNTCVVRQWRIDRLVTKDSAPVRC